MFFATNSRCYLPLHTLIADVIETCGGSPGLTNLINRFGVCASIDTHARYIQYQVDKSKREGPMRAFPSDSFVELADNLDYVHSYAHIYCGNQQSSWYGTTVQLVQPQPSILVDNKQANIHINSPTEKSISSDDQITTNLKYYHILTNRHDAMSSVTFSC